MQKNWKNKNVAVLMGGKTKEREISLRTGRAISNALKGLGYNVTDIDVGDDLVDQIRSKKIEAVVIALHGKWGEDGCVQGLLEMLQIPYSGTAPLGSSICMNKEVTSLIACSLGVPVPKERVYCEEKSSLEEFVQGFDSARMYVVKPSREGSSINVSIVKGNEQLKEAVQKALESDDHIIVQDYIEGKEITAGVLDGEILPLLEIAPTNKFYDYEAKYTKGKSQYIIPAGVSKDCASRITSQCKSLSAFLDLRGAARIDYIVTPENKEYFLEVNTIPGMTELSLVPMAAAHVGIKFPELAEKILLGSSLKG